MMLSRGMWPAIGKRSQPDLNFNVEYPDLCGTTRNSDCKDTIFFGNCQRIPKIFTIFATNLETL